MTTETNGYPSQDAPSLSSEFCLKCGERHNGWVVHPSWEQARSVCSCNPDLPEKAPQFAVWVGYRQ